MRIALTGTHSTGKTTLINSLLEDEFFTKLKPSFSNTRKLSSIGLPINKSNSDDYTLTQELVLSFHMRDLMYTNLLSDRCLIDGYAYTKYLYNKGKIEKDLLVYFETLLKLFVGRYDFIFYSPILKEMDDDGVREEDSEFREGVDKIIKETIEKLGSKKVFTLPSYDIIENKKYILKTIKNYGD